MVVIYIMIKEVEL